MLVAQSCLTLCDSMDYSLPGSSVHGILQARVLEWVAIPFSKRSSQPRDWTQVFCIACRFFPIWATREAHKKRTETKTKKIKNSSQIFFPIPPPPFKAKKWEQVGGQICPDVHFVPSSLPPSSGTLSPSRTFQGLLNDWKQAQPEGSWKAFQRERMTELLLGGWEWFRSRKVARAS